MPAPPHAMQDAMPLAMLTAVCAVAEGALPEREPLPRVFAGLLHLIPRLPLGDAMLTELIQWELMVLSDLGYGLDLSACAVTGRTEGLTYVSPKTGRAVTDEGAGDVGRPPAAVARLPDRCGAARPHGLARRPAPDRPFPGARCVRPSASPSAPGARDAIRPSRRHGRLEREKDDASKHAG